MLLISVISKAQVTDTTIIIKEEKTIISQTTVSENHTSFKTDRTPFFKKKLVRTMIVPTILIGWGVSVISTHGLYSSVRCSTDIAKLNITPGFSSIDDYLIWVPYAGLATLELMSIDHGKNDFINTSLLIGKSALLTAAVFQIGKYTTKVERPDRDPDDWQRFLSFPSGHTAMAFATATLFHRELGQRSHWYSIGAYTVASSVGVMRMVHNRHWEADVFVGAGLGILCTNVVYLTHKYRWGKKPDMSIVPMYNKGAAGLCFTKQF